jgi:hypothetical protein
MLLRPVPANLYLEPPVLVPDRYEVGFAGGMRAYSCEQFGAPVERQKAGQICKFLAVSTES